MSTLPVLLGFDMTNTRCCAVLCCAFESCALFFMFFCFAPHVVGVSVFPCFFLVCPGGQKGAVFAIVKTPLCRSKRPRGGLFIPCKIVAPGGVFTRIVTVYGFHPAK